MSLMTVPTYREGDSLPAELRVNDAFRGSTYFSRARMAKGMQGLTRPPALSGWGRSGLRGLGQDCGTDEVGDPIPCDTGSGSGDGSGSGSSSGLPPLTTCASVCAPGQVQDPVSCACVGTPTYSGGCQGACANGSFMDQSTCTCVGAPSLQSLGVSASAIPGYSSTANGGQTIYPPSATTPTAPAGMQWATMINASGQAIAKILTVSQGGTAITLPNGNQLLYGSAAASVAGVAGLTSSSLNSLLPILLIGGGLLLVMKLAK